MQAKCELKATKKYTKNRLTRYLFLSTMDLFFFFKFMC